MKNVEHIKSIEEFNKQYLQLYHSKSVRFMRNIARLRKLNMNDSYRLVKKKITTKIGSLKIKYKIKSSPTSNFYYNFGSPMENIKVAVYTCITKGYDIVKSPVYVGDDVDYHLFTDSSSDNVEVWKGKKINCKYGLNEANRYYKFHPNIFDDKYDFAIYIDGNVKVVSDPTTICYIARNSKVGIAMHRHHSRDCVYKEGLACKYYKRGNIENIMTQLNRFKDEGFPEEFGLFEATVIVYDLKNPIAKKIANEWWNYYYESGTRRDQIFFPYIIWKHGFNISDVGDLGNNLWKNPKFIVFGHD